MNFSSLNPLNWFRRSDKIDPKHPRDPALASMFGLGYVSATGAVVTPDTALTEAAVMACIRVLSESVAQLPLLVYRRLPDGGKERADKHPLYNLLHLKPNRLQGSFGWRETGQAHLGLRGNFYCLIEQNRIGEITELMPLDPDRMNVFLAPTGERAYEYQPVKGQRQILLQDEVFHVLGLCLMSDGHKQSNSYDGLCGVSPITYARETIGHALGSKEYGTRFYSNNAQPGGVLEHPATLSDDAAKRLRDSWEKRHAGLGNAHRVAILEEGMKFHPISVTPADAQFLETRKYTRSEIAAIYRVPLHMIGDLDRATFSNIEQQSIDFVTHTLMPWLKRWEETINIALFSEADRQAGYFAEFLVTGLLRGDAQARGTYYNQLFQIGVLSINDIRAMENMNPIKNGDIHFVPLNMVTTDRAKTLKGEGNEPATKT